jgi:hypothetical protein
MQTPDYSHAIADLVRRTLQKRVHEPWRPPHPPETRKYVRKRTGRRQAGEGIMLGMGGIPALRRMKDFQ